MAFQDYSTTPAANTTIGESTFIGPNMPRDNVRPALQQLAADGKDLADAVTALANTGANTDGLLRPDLASTASGKGSAMVGFKQSGTATVATDLNEVASRVFHATDLIGELDPADDHGALLTAAIESRFGTLATSQSTSPVTIDFGDSRYSYNLETPIIVQQNNIRLVANGAVLQCSGNNAIVGDHAASANILFCFEVRGFTLKGTINDDAIVIKSGSQCVVSDIRNYADVGLAVVWFTGTVSSQTYSIKSDAVPIGPGASQVGTCLNLIRETLYTKFGNDFNCIANTHEDALGYFCNGAAISLNESDFCRVSGDFEQCDGPAVDLLNCRFCTVSVYTEINGQGATNVGTDTPDDIRIRSSGAGSIITQSTSITVSGCKMGGQLVNGVTPTNVHILDGDDCLIIANDLGGNLVIEAGCLRTNLGAQARFIGTLTENGSDTINSLTPGRSTWKIGTGERATFDAFAAGGAKFGSDQGLMRLYGLTSIGKGVTPGNNFAGHVDIVDAATTGNVTFGVAEPDANYEVILTLRDVSGASASKSVRSTTQDATGFNVELDAAPGVGKTVRVSWMIVRTA